MKNNIKNLVLIISVIFLVNGCDNYLDVNTPSGAQEESTLEMKDIIGPVMKNTVMANYYASTVFSNYAQNFGSYGWCQWVYFTWKYLEYNIYGYTARY